ncbi:MAG: hypothetical protein ACYSUD_11845 [Planctomycetota bacterium]|jgi:hypothetical protein
MNTREYRMQERKWMGLHRHKAFLLTGLSGVGTVPRAFGLTEKW